MQLLPVGMTLTRTRISCSAPFLWLNYSIHIPQAPNLRLPTINRLEEDITCILNLANLANLGDPTYNIHGITSPDETYPVFPLSFLMFRPDMYIHLPSLIGTVHLDSMRCNANKHYNILYNLSAARWPRGHRHLHPHPLTLRLTRL